MRIFTREREKAQEPEAEAAKPAPPADPIELGYTLRSARERLGVRLEQVRDSIGIPVVDLDSLERGRLEVLHSQQAALVALRRYADFLGLESNELLGVVRSNWPHRGLSVDAFASGRGFTPLSELEAAAQLLSPIANMPDIDLWAPQMGLSETTRLNLESGAARRIFARQMLVSVALPAERPRLSPPAMSALAAPPRAERRLVAETAAEEADAIDDAPVEAAPDGFAEDGVDDLMVEDARDGFAEDGVDDLMVEDAPLTVADPPSETVDAVVDGTVEDEVVDEGPEVVEVAADGFAEDGVDDLMVEDAVPTVVAAESEEQVALADPGDAVEVTASTEVEAVVEAAEEVVVEAEVVAPTPEVEPKSEPAPKVVPTVERAPSKEPPPLIFARSPRTPDANSPAGSGVLGRWGRQVERFVANRFGIGPEPERLSWKFALVTTRHSPRSMTTGTGESVAVAGFPQLEAPVPVHPIVASRSERIATASEEQPEP